MHANPLPASTIACTHSFAAEDGRCMCLVDSESEEQARRLEDTAGLPSERVVPALDLAPQA